MKMQRLLSLCLLAATLALASGSSAQPMIDPAMMSGTPRPEGQVPAGAIRVRLLNKGFGNNIADTEVELQSTTGQRLVQKSDADGRALFTSLPSGTYRARAKKDGETLETKEIPLGSAGPGMAVMLVFGRGLGSQGTEAAPVQPTPAAPAPAAGNATLQVKVVDEAGKPLPGVAVVVRHGDMTTGQFSTIPEQRTDAQGIAAFANLRGGENDAYMAAALKDGQPHNGQPFRIEGGNHTETIQILPPTTDVTKLVFAEGSHLIFQLSDEVLQVLVNLLLKNPTQQIIQPGTQGLRIPLPEGILSPQVLPMEEGQSPPYAIDMSVDGEPAIVWKGTIRPGIHEIRVAFIHKHDGTVRFRQKALFGFEGLVLGVQQAPDLQLEGTGYTTKTVSMGGQNFLRAQVPPVKAGDWIEFKISGLPYNLPWPRYIAGALAVCVLGLFTWMIHRANAEKQGSAGPASEAARRRDRLEKRRQVLLGQILQLERDGTDKDLDKEPAKQKLLAELEQVYLDLESQEPA